MTSRFVIYFALLSVVGYFYECLAMTIWAGKWENRGFLFGPAIPIYGAGATIGTILFTYFYTSYSYMSVFLISMAASAILEYVVHYVLEKTFHAYWWDYSMAPLNINGRICLPASIGFGIAGLIIIYVINPYIMPKLMAMNDETAQLLALISVALMSADLTASVSVISNFIKRVENTENSINEQMDSFVGSFLDESKAVGNRFYSAMDKIGEKKRKYVDYRFERIAESYGDMYAHVISGIKGFRGNRYSARLNEVLSKVKRKIKRTKE